MGLVLQSPPQPGCPSLDTLQPLHVLLAVRGPKPNTALEVQPHQCRDSSWHLCSKEVFSCPSPLIYSLWIPPCSPWLQTSPQPTSTPLPRSQHWHIAETYRGFQRLPGICVNNIHAVLLILPGQSALPIPHSLFSHTHFKTNLLWNLVPYHDKATNKWLWISVRA